MSLIFGFVLMNFHFIHNYKPDESIQGYYIKHILMRPPSKNKQTPQQTNIQTKTDDFQVHSEIAHKTCSIFVWVQFPLNRVC